VGLLAARECAGPAGAVPLGALALALALASYAAAFAGGAARRAGPVAAHFYALLGMLLALTGSALLDLGAAGGTAWSLLGLAALLLAPRASSSALAIQGALWLWVGAAQAGLFAFAASAFAGGGSSPFAHLSFPCLIALTSALGAAAVLLLRRGETGVDHGVRAATLALLALSVDALAAALGTWALHAGDAGALAAMRTGVLAASALALATSSRALGARELRWLSLATLALGGVKLALDDLPHGRASTYVIGFALYGLALILVPRLTRASPAQE